MNKGSEGNCFVASSRKEIRSLFIPLPISPITSITTTPQLTHPPTTPSHTHKLKKQNLETKRTFIPFCQFLPNNVAWIHHSYRKVLTFRVNVIKSLVKFTFECHLG